MIYIGKILYITFFKGVVIGMSQNSNDSYDMSLQPIIHRRIFSSNDSCVSSSLRGDSWLISYLPADVPIHELAYEDLMMYIPDGIFSRMSLQELELFVQSINKYSSPLKDITFGQLKNLHKNLWEKFIKYKNFFPQLADISLVLYKKQLLDITYGELKEIPEKIINEFTSKKKILLEPLEFFIKYIDDEYNKVYSEPLILEDITFSKLQKMKIIMEIQLENKRFFLKNLIHDIKYMEELINKFNKKKIESSNLNIKRSTSSILRKKTISKNILEDQIRKTTSRNLEERMSFKIFAEQSAHKTSVERISLQFVEKLLLNDLEELNSHLNSYVLDEMMLLKKQETAIIEDIKINCHTLSKINNRIDEINIMISK